MGSEDHGKLGHQIKVPTAEEIKNEALRYKKHGQVPGIAVNKGAVGFVNGDWSSPIVQVSCGNSHTVALTQNGEVYSWGHGKLGALGHGSDNDEPLPKQVKSLKNIVKVQCGSEFTLVLDEHGKLFAFG